MTDDATPRILQGIQATLTALDRKVGVLAESLVRLGSRIDELTTEVSSLRTTEMAGLRGDFHVIALAIDEHGHRLAAVEDRLARIETHLPLTRQ